MTMLHINLPVDTICPKGWELYDQDCIQINTKDKLSFYLADLTGCEAGTLYRSTWIGPWIKVKRLNAI